jgi:hypothetical protein
MKTIICEGPTDMEFLIQLFNVRKFKIKSREAEGNVVKVVMSKGDEEISIVSVGGVGNIRNYLKTKIAALITKGEIKEEDILIVVDEADFKEEQKKEEIEKYRIVKIPTNLEYYIVKKLKECNLLTDLIGFWEARWGKKIEESSPRDVKEIFYLFHSILLRNVDPKERCLKKVVEKICERLGEERMEEIGKELGIF